MKKNKFKDILNILQETYAHWADDKALKLSASLSFYAILSLVPILVIVISLSGLFIGQETAANSIIYQVKELFGEEGAELFQKLTSHSFFTESGTIPTIISGVILIFSSLGVFIELKESLNIIWGIEIKPGKGLKLFFKSRLVTFPIVFVIGFLLIISLIISALINLLSSFLLNILPEILPLVQYGDYFVSIIIYTLLFGTLFKFLPDVSIKWSHVWEGALFTAILFSIGKFLIVFYLGNTYYGNVYGAAGSLVLLLIWIYYSSIIFFFGAEFTYVIGNRHSNIEPKVNKDFVKIKKRNQQITEATDRNDSIN